MTRTNTLPRAAKLKTHEGGTAVLQRPKEDLLRAVSTCLLFEDTFYEKGSDLAQRIAELVKQNTPERVAEVAKIARNDLHLRHVPLWLAVQMSLAFRGNSVVSKTIENVVQRPDEMAELVSLYWKAVGDERKTPGRSRLPAQLKKGLAAAFTKFDAYRLAKWNRLDRAVKLRDVLFLTHAKPKDEAQAALWKSLIANTLETPDTWEVAISAAPKETKPQAWERLLLEHKLGPMALIMNLRNLEEAKVLRSAVVAELNRIDGRSKLLPFRFLAAAKFAPAFADELSAAMVRSISELPKLTGTTALVIDASGSMTSTTISAKSKLDRLDAAAGLAVLIREVCETARVFVYSNECAEVLNLRGIGLVQGIRNWPGGGGGTNTASALEGVQRKLPSVARVILITDEQAHDGIIPSWAAYGYLVNVAPYAPGLDTSGKWKRINGWSERLVDWISYEETGAILTASSSGEVEGQSEA